MSCPTVLAPRLEMKRQWILAIGAGALLSGMALYVITVAAVPTTMVFGTEMPVACAYGSSSQSCADATARLAVMKQIQPISWFVASVGGVLLAYGGLQKADSLGGRAFVRQTGSEPTELGPRNQEGESRVKRVREVEMATCGNCNASVREDAFRCPSCGAEFADAS
jgi:hypothetical protein